MHDNKNELEQGFLSKHYSNLFCTLVWCAQDLHEQIPLRIFQPTIYIPSLLFYGKILAKGKGRTVENFT